MMLKKICCLLCACLVLLAAVPALAAVLKPMETEIDLADLSYVKTAGVPGEYADGRLTLTLYEPEPFSAAEVAALQVGDSIVIGGAEIQITSLDLGTESAAINEDSGENMYFLYMDEYRNFIVMDEYDMTTYRELGEVSCEVAAGALFLDGVDPASGEPLSTRTEHSFEEFLTIRAEEEANQGIGFNKTNTTLTFNAEGQLETIERVYTPWQ